MKKRRHPFAAALICVGALMIMAIVMPSAFWWIVFGGVLIFCGIALCRR